MVQATRHQSSVIADPSVRRISPVCAVAAVNVSRVVAVVKPELSSDSTRPVMVGVLVPATDRTCREAYRRSPAATAPSCRPVPVPDAVRAVPDGWATRPRARGQDPMASAAQGAISPTSPSSV
jgi:hypothetical protein